MKIVDGCKCGEVLSEKNIVSRVGPATLFGLPKGTLGNSKARFARIQCTRCGREYVGQLIPGRSGGSLRLNRLLDVEGPVIEVEPKRRELPEPEELEIPDEQEAVGAPEIEFDDTPKSAKAQPRGKKSTYVMKG